jgi:hypothetical protein
MTSLMKTTALVGVGTIGAAVLAAVPASAATIAGCGDAPVGGQLERTGDICEIDFSASGDYSWTVPAGLTDLYAVVVGAGGGAVYDADRREGYAGSGGEVIYADLATPAAGAVVEVSVGSGGTSGPTAPTPGSSSSVTASGTVTAAGGAAGTFFDHYCPADGDYSVYVGNGNGAGGSAGPSGDNCVDSTAPGVQPSADVDSAAADPLAIFSTVTTEFGAGGRIVSSLAGPLDSGAAYDGSGRGADILHLAGSSDPFVQSSLPDVHDTAASGRVLLRYTAFAPAAEGGGDVSDGDALAATGAGSGSIATMGVAAGLGLAGAVLMALSRRRAATVRPTR